VTVHTEPELTVGSSTAEPGAEWAPTHLARARVAALVTSGEPVIICAHRQNLAWLLAHVCATLDAPVPDGPPLRKGAFWVLQAGEGRLASAEQHQAGPAD
jgi:hypothetical protein